MPPLDHDGVTLLRRIQYADGDAVSGDVAHTTGESDSGSLALTLDAARRVVAVEVRSVDDLRRPGDLATAVRTAFAIADDRRILASLEASGELARYVALGEERIAGRRPLQIPPGPSVHRGAQRPSGAATPAGATGTSDNTYLSVRLDAEGVLLAVDADEAWLSTARPEHLKNALATAFRDAARHLLDRPIQGA
ncbi:hypothetical protein ABLE68_13560 [Nocardioides sp. CN2-186]|uniref:hypothetical protein n=1 Tax=Nocardioides tweenelious TaxID=3156607 RepID=UPI0032B5923D